MNQHDTYFRKIMSQPDVAAGALRSIIPDEIAKRIDWSLLEARPETLITDDLQGTCADVILRTRWDGYDADIYVLAEHQSSPDPKMALRMLGYVEGVWEIRKKDRPRSKPNRLTMVLPVVVHCNPRGRRWTACTDLAGLIDLGEAQRDALGGYVPRFRYIVDDLNRVSVAALRARHMAPKALVMMWSLKTVPGNDHLGDDLREIEPELHELVDGPDGDAEWRLVVAYILAKGGTDRADLVPVVKRLGPRAMEDMMAMEGKIVVEATARGMAEGRAAGQAEGRVDALLEALTDRFGTLPKRVLETVRSADIAQLQEWNRRAWSASSLDEVVGF